MSRYRLQPSPAQEQALLEHCRHARFVWNLAVQQHSCWRPGRKSAPGFAEQCRQLTEARAFAAIPGPVPAPGLGVTVGVDRGVAVSAALSTGEMLNVPGLRGAEKACLLRLLRKLARAERGSKRRGRVKAAVARLKARETGKRVRAKRVTGAGPADTPATPM